MSGERDGAGARGAGSIEGHGNAGGTSLAPLDRVAEAPGELWRVERGPPAGSASSERVREGAPPLGLAAHWTLL